MMAKGTYASLMLASKVLDDVFERIQASGAEVMQWSLSNSRGAPVTALCMTRRET